MVAKHSSKRPRGRPNPPPTNDPLPASTPQPAPSAPPALAPAAERAINAERRELQKAVAILGCLVIALEYGDDEDPADAPDYSDVARALRSMIARSITRLDPTNLERAADLPTATPESMRQLGAPAP